MKKPRKLVTISTLIGLLLSSMMATASVTIDPADEANVDNYCPSSGSQHCESWAVMGHACGTIHISQRPQKYCCQQEIRKCIGHSNTWTVAWTTFSQTCGSNQKCVDQGVGTEEPEEPGDPEEPADPSGPPIGG
jgi:hypothetical protein